MGESLDNQLRRTEQNDRLHRSRDVSTGALVSQHVQGSTEEPESSRIFGSNVFSRSLSLCGNCCPNFRQTSASSSSTSNASIDTVIVPTSGVPTGVTSVIPLGFTVQLFTSIVTAPLVQMIVKRTPSPTETIRNSYPKALKTLNVNTRLTQLDKASKVYGVGFGKNSKQADFIAILSIPLLLERLYLWSAR